MSLPSKGAGPKSPSCATDMIARLPSGKEARQRDLEGQPETALVPLPPQCEVRSSGMLPPACACRYLAGPHPHCSTTHQDPGVKHDTSARRPSDQCRILSAQVRVSAGAQGRISYLKRSHADAAASVSLCVVQRSNKVPLRAMTQMLQAVIDRKLHASQTTAAPRCVPHLFALRAFTSMIPASPSALPLPNTVLSVQRALPCCAAAGPNRTPSLGPGKLSGATAPQIKGYAARSVTFQPMHLIAMQCHVPCGSHARQPCCIRFRAASPEPPCTPAAGPYTPLRCTYNPTIHPCPSSHAPHVAMPYLS